MISDVQRKPLSKDLSYREGRVYCRLWDKDIPVMLFDEDVTVEYAERCAEAMNDMSPELIDAICRAARMYCIEFCDEISDEWRQELDLTVPVDENTPLPEMLKCFSPTGLEVSAPADPSRIGYQLECSCDWEEEHGMEIDVLDGKLVYLGSFNAEGPWEDHSKEEWNYAVKTPACGKNGDRE